MTAATKYPGITFRQMLATNQRRKPSIELTDDAEPRTVLEDLATKAIDLLPVDSIVTEDSAKTAAQRWCLGIIETDWTRGRRQIGQPWAFCRDNRREKFAFRPVTDYPFDVNSIVEQISSYPRKITGYSVSSTIRNVFKTSARMVELLSFELVSFACELRPTYENLVRLVWDLEDMLAAWKSLGLLQTPGYRPLRDERIRDDAVLHLTFCTSRVPELMSCDTFAAWKPKDSIVGWSFGVAAAFDAMKTLMSEYYNIMGWRLGAAVISAKDLERTLPGRYETEIRRITSELCSAASQVQGRNGLIPVSLVVSQPQPVIYNRFQMDILEALENRALTKQKLADRVSNGDGRRLYKKGGLRELMAAGLVENRRRIGYYRPHVPPPGLVVT
jgi:hypothetical protein